MRGIRRSKDIATAKRMRHAGASLYSICEKLCASKSSVYEWTRGIQRPYKCTPRGRWDGKRKPRPLPKPKKLRMRNGPYILIVAPDWFSGKRYRGKYCYEHHAVWSKKNGAIPSGSIIHHRNGSHTDNRIENLELMTSSQHSRHHLLLRGRSKVDQCAVNAPLQGIPGSNPGLGATLEK